tara:strand:+ start:179 stop:298 length:120 start_codon:yes stop_codon:yes gene_type:complete
MQTRLIVAYFLIGLIVAFLAVALFAWRHSQKRKNKNRWR